MKVTVTTAEVDDKNIKMVFEIQGTVESSVSDYRFKDNLTQMITRAIAKEYLQKNMSRLLGEIRSDELMNSLYMRLTNKLMGDSRD